MCRHTFLLKTNFIDEILFEEKMDTLAEFIVDDSTFERMLLYDDRNEWNNMTYAGFILWNTKCFEELEADHRQDVLRICSSIKRQFIKLVDEENCCEMSACSIYFNKNKQLCIVNPR
jgi:hypothetical protein